MVRGQLASLARILGLHPYSFSKDILGFLMTTESQDLGLTSHPKDGAFFFLQYSVSISQEVSHPGTDQAQPCLASVGNQSWAAG